MFWDAPDGEWCAAEATIEILEPPTVPVLYFWALQVGFAGPDGTSGGGAHLGLQWFPPHPGSTAVNWGGYRPAGGELEGSRSPLPSAPGNPNTRDFTWVPRRPYRLAVRPAGPADGPGRADGSGRDSRSGSGGGSDRGTAWRGEVTDLVTGTTTVVRDLWAPGDRIASPMVWSEVFAACDDPQVVVRWSDLAVVDRAGRRTAVDTVTVNYQSLADGGCVTTDARVDDAGFVQTTAVERSTPGGTQLQRR